MTESFAPRTRSLWSRIGPAFIVGAVIIGPGSVTLMSSTGAMYGYSMLWLSLLAGALMAGHIALFMRFGIYCDDTLFGLAAKKLGRWFTVLCGLALFSAGSAFQTGNNLGVTAAMEALFGRVPQVVWPIVFTVAAIVFLFGLKHIYRAVEKLMTVFLVGMFCAFLVNLIAARPDLGEAAKGAFVPSIPEGANWVTLGGLVATTFVIAGAFFQSYLVKAKGWHARDLKDATTDTILASITYTLIGTVIMMTAAAVVYPHSGGITFEVMVEQLEGVFYPYAKVVFAVGFWAAAFSSFITNALIAGLLLNDGLGLGGQLESRATRGLAAVAMVIGMAVAITVLLLQHSGPVAAGQIDVKVTAIMIGQASTLLAVPLAAIAMIVVLFDDQAVKGRGLPVWAKTFVLIGAALLVGVAALTLLKVKASLAGLLGAG